MPIPNRLHGQCNFLLKWFVRMSLCTYGSQSLACHKYIDCDSALRHCMPTPVKYPVLVTSISTRPFSCVTGRFVGGGGGGVVNCCDHPSYHRLCSLPRPCRSCLHGWNSGVLSWTAMNWRRNPYENTWECYT